jgi:hypothetical protein
VLPKRAIYRALNSAKDRRRIGFLDTLDGHGRSQLRAPELTIGHKEGFCKFQ